MLDKYFVLGVYMLVMHLCARIIDFGHAFVCYGYRCLSCVCVLVVSMLVMYLCVGVSVLVMYLWVRGIYVGNAFVCWGYRC